MSDDLYTWDDENGVYEVFIPVNRIGDFANELVKMVKTFTKKVQHINHKDVHVNESLLPFMKYIEILYSYSVSKEKTDVIVKLYENMSKNYLGSDPNTFSVSFRFIKDDAYGSYAGGIHIKMWEGVMNDDGYAVCVDKQSQSNTMTKRDLYLEDIKNGVKDLSSGDQCTISFSNKKNDQFNIDYMLFTISMSEVDEEQHEYEFEQVSENPAALRLRGDCDGVKSFNIS